MKRIDPEMLLLLGLVFSLLILASLVGAVLHFRVKSEAGRATVQNLNARIRAWWVMCLVFVGATFLGPLGSVTLFATSSFFALREFLTLTPTRRSDHAGLVWSFFVLLPLQYYFIFVDWYGMFSIFIPVYAFLFIPIRSVLSGDAQDFLARTARIQWALMVCVYCVSYAPALLTLDIPGFTGNGKLLFFLVCVVQLSDVFQYVWGKLLGRHKVAPTISPNKTVEGLVGGVASATAIGAGLFWATPFAMWQAALMALAICIAGFFGGLTMSAIKRDRGAKDFGSMIEGHGGVLDRIDSICFSAPLFFHLVRYFFVP